MESLEYKGVPGGGVAAYRIEDNKLSFLNSRYAYGGWPCHVIADEEKDSLLVSVFRNGCWWCTALIRMEALGRKDE